MHKKTVLITGCSTGIGLDTASTLKSKGYRVIASCRKKEDVDKLLSTGMEVVQLDLNDSLSIQSAFTAVLAKTEGRLDVLINNAGYGQAGALEDVSREVLRQQFETNVFGLLELTNLAIPVMRQQGRGWIINISSILGIVSLPFRGAYNASKYALEGLSDTLRLELQSSGIKVITIEPGPIESRFRDNCIDGSLHHIDQQGSYFSKQYVGTLARYKANTVNALFTKKSEVVVKKIIHAIEAKKPKIKYPVTFLAHLLIFLKRILSTRSLDKLLLAAAKKELS